MNGNWPPYADFRALLSHMNRRQLIRGAGAVAGAAALSGVTPKDSRRRHAEFAVLAGSRGPRGGETVRG